ncbi:hypothetical protein UFOVP1604_163 [uncultured Caudovirales phage]|uniref:Uncharacterized protein n=1 Tax=uncultured Caudovirales phage TaxID=2100421 RepID=A0A6J5SV07_9CAUD|nr:hypothetical protein UFOVP1604_163 [uncultured Caudovirales phage]
MKSKEEIEYLAANLANPNVCKTTNWIEGYTQCQEDIVEELKEWIDITLSAESKLGASDNVIEALLGVKYKIESLTKQG